MWRSKMNGPGKRVGAPAGALGKRVLVEPINAEPAIIDTVSLSRKWIEAGKGRALVVGERKTLAQQKAVVSEVSVAEWVALFKQIVEIFTVSRIGLRCDRRAAVATGVRQRDGEREWVVRGGGVELSG